MPIEPNILDRIAGLENRIVHIETTAEMPLVTITGGGTIALGGFTLTIPATGTAALLATANVFTAGQEISVASGDPVIILDIGGTNKFTVGVDDSDSDKFKICVGGALVTTGALLTFDGTYFVVRTGSGAAAVMIDAAADSILQYREVSALRYEQGYSSVANYFYLQTGDGDGGGTDADVFRIVDGQTTIDANTTWDANVFDYVCESCGWHGPDKVPACPDCGGNVEWHDDAALMYAAGRGGRVCDMPEKTLAALERFGVISRDGDQVFLRLQSAQWFAYSAIAQLWQRLNRLEEARG